MVQGYKVEEPGIEVIKMMQTKTKHVPFPLFPNPQASLVWIKEVGMMAGVGLEHCQKDNDNGGGHRDPGNGSDDHVGILKALKMVGAVRAIIWNILLPCLNKSYASYKGKECGLKRFFVFCFFVVLFFSQFAHL